MWKKNQPPPRAAGSRALPTRKRAIGNLVIEISKYEIVLYIHYYLGIEGNTVVTGSLRLELHDRLRRIIASQKTIR